MGLQNLSGNGSFKLLSRDPNLLSGVLRLTSVDEVKSNFEEIKGILEQYEQKTGTVVRLLDGWVTWSGEYYYGYMDDMSTMTHMLLVKTNKLRPSDGSFDPEMYFGVKLSAQRRQAALLLSSDDEITEVIYFVLYLFAKDARTVDKLILKIKFAILFFIILCLSIVLRLRYSRPGQIC